MRKPYPREWPAGIHTSTRASYEPSASTCEATPPLWSPDVPGSRPGCTTEGVRQDYAPVKLVPLLRLAEERKPLFRRVRQLLHLRLRPPLVAVHLAVSSRPSAPPQFVRTRPRGNWSPATARARSPTLQRGRRHRRALPLAHRRRPSAVTVHCAKGSVGPCGSGGPFTASASDSLRAGGVRV